MKKYPINKEFYPQANFYNPIRSARLAGWVGSMFKPPKKLFKDHEMMVSRIKAKSYDGGEFEMAGGSFDAHTAVRTSVTISSGIRFETIKAAILSKFTFLPSNYTYKIKFIVHLRSSHVSARQKNHRKE